MSAQSTPQKRAMIVNKISSTNSQSNLSQVFFDAEQWLVNSDDIQEQVSVNTGKFGKILSKQLFSEVNPENTAIRFQPSDHIFEISWNRKPSSEEINRLKTIIEYRNLASTLQNQGWQADLMENPADNQSASVEIRLLDSKTIANEKMKLAEEQKIKTVQKYESVLNALDALNNEIATQLISPEKYQSLEANALKLKKEITAISVPDGLSKQNQAQLKKEKKQLTDTADILVEQLSIYRDNAENAHQFMEKFKASCSRPNALETLPDALKELKGQVKGLARAHRQLHLESARGLLKGLVSGLTKERLSQFISDINPKEDCETVCEVLNQMDDARRTAFFESLSVSQKGEYFDALQDYASDQLDLSDVASNLAKEVLAASSQSEFNELMEAHPPRTSTKVVVNLLLAIRASMRVKYFKALSTYQKHDLHQGLIHYQKKLSQHNRQKNEAQQQQIKVLLDELVSGLNKKEKAKLFPAMSVKELNKNTLKKLIQLPEDKKQFVEERDEEGSVSCSISFEDAKSNETVYVRNGNQDSFHAYKVSKLETFIAGQEKPFNMHNRDELKIIDMYRD